MIIKCSKIIYAFTRNDKFREFFTTFCKYLYTCVNFTRHKKRVGISSYSKLINLRINNYLSITLIWSNQQVGFVTPLSIELTDNLTL